MSRKLSYQMKSFLIFFTAFTIYFNLIWFFLLFLDIFIFILTWIYLWFYFALLITKIDCGRLSYVMIRYRFPCFYVIAFLKPSFNLLSISSAHTLTMKLKIRESAFIL